MNRYAAEMEKIKKTLRANPRGMTILNLSRELNISRNSAAKYLDILRVSGQVEMESVGAAKVYFLSHRVPASTLINYSSDHVLVIDDQFKVTQINDVFLHLLAVTRENAIGKDIDDPFFPFSTNPDILTKIDEAMLGDEYIGDIALSVTGKNFQFRIKIIPSSLDNGISGVSIVMSDVTEEKELHQRLNKYHRLLEELTSKDPAISAIVSDDDSQEGILHLKEKSDRSHTRIAKNQAILDAMPDLIFLLRKDGTFLDYVAPSDKHLFAPPSEFIGEKVSEVLPEKLAEQMMHSIEQALETNLMQTIQYELPINDNILHYETRIVATDKDEVMAIATDITERKQAEKALHESKIRVKRKLNAIIEPDGDIGELELADIIDSDYFQSLMEDFNRLTGHLLSIGDLHGNPLVAVGWQDICTKFHRVHPETCTYCTESDLQLCSSLKPGEFRLYQCKNGLWDAITPIFVENKYLGNIYYGQFFFDDEEIPYDKFRNQARKYGFDEEKYMEALDKVPRVSREKVDTIMSFYTRLTHLISRLSYSNIKLARTLNERDNLLTSLHDSESRFRSLFELAAVGVAQVGPDGFFIEVNEYFSKMLGYSVDELSAMNFRDITHPDDLHLDQKYVEESIAGKIDSYEMEKRFIHKKGHIVWANLHVRIVKDKNGVGIYAIAVIVDITEKKRCEN